MRTLPLGKDGFTVSEVGLGCWQLGNEWGGTVDDREAQELLGAAAEAGVTFFDTADVYGDGRSERAIGKFLRGAGKDYDIRVATKFGRGGGVFPDGYTEAALRKAVDASRARLGVETLDLLQLHCVPFEVMRDGEIFGWLRDLQREGLIRHFGASVETVEEALFCLEQEGLQSLQIIFNLFRQKPIDALLPRAVERGVGIVVRLPLASGLLTGKFDADTTFPADDHRNFNADGEAFNVGETFAGLPFRTGVALADQLEADYLPQGLTMVQLALRWILDQPGVTTIIPGASSPAQARANAAVAELPPLSEELLGRLRGFYGSEVADNIRGPY